MTMELPTEAPVSRRPLNSRNRAWAKWMARQLSQSDITPNQISVASVCFAALGFVFMFAAGLSGTFATLLLLIFAAVTIQLRLLCNLLDGMVAVEGGKSEPTGPFWNEAPDRAADLLFLWGAGFAAGSPALGLACAVLAVATAYLRELGRAEGFAPDFTGPMAKPHRMAALTVTCLAAALLPVGWTSASILLVGLWLILIGTAVTIARRAWRLLAHMDGA